MRTMTLREINNLKKKASDSIKEKEKQNFLKNILPHLKLIKNTLFYLECQYSNRGKCLCIWDGEVYYLKDGKAIPYKEFTIEYIHKSEKDGYFECIKKYNDGKEYYFLNKNFYINEKLIHEWIQKNYLTLKVMVTNIHSKKENDLSDFSILGTLAADFSNKFPNKNIEDLINYYKIYDKFVINNILNL